MIAAFFGSSAIRGIIIRVAAIAIPLLILLASLARSRSLKQKVDELDAYKQTVKRAKRSDVSRGDPDADREWLRARGKR